MAVTYCAATEDTQQEGKGELNAANVNSIGVVMSNVRSALEMYKFLHATEVGAESEQVALSHSLASGNVSQVWSVRDNSERSHNSAI